MEKLAQKDVIRLIEVLVVFLQPSSIHMENLWCKQTKRTESLYYPAAAHLHFS